MKLKLKYPFIRLAILVYCILASRAPLCAQQPRSNASFIVEYSDAKPNDSLGFYILNNFTNNALEEPKYEVKVGRSPEGIFKFSCQLNSELENFQIKLLPENENGSEADGELVLPETYLEPGDNIYVKIWKNPTASKFSSGLKKYMFKASGTGSEKLIIQKSLYDELVKTSTDPGPLFDTKYNFNRKYLNSSEMACNFIRTRKADLSPIAFSVLLADVYFGNSNIFSTIRAYIDERRNVVSEQLWNKMRTSFFNSIAMSDVTQKFPMTGLLKSNYYLKFIAERAYLKEYLNNKDGAYRRAFKKLLSNYNNEIKDKALIYALLYLPFDSSLSENILTAEKVVKTDYCVEKLREIKFRSEGGDFFQFGLEDNAGNTSQLGFLKGKIVLVDFWFTGCGACMDFYRSVLSKAKTAFKGSDQVVFVSICADKQRDRWLGSIKSEKYTSLGAFNYYTGGLGFKHPILNNLQISSYPTLLIFDQSGVLRSFDNREFRYNPEKLMGYLRSLMNTSPSL